MKLVIENRDADGNNLGDEIVDYRKEVLSRASEIGNPMLGLAGLTGELGEYAELLKKEWFHGITADPEKVKKELGDVLWYLTYAADVHGLEIEEIAIENVKKLRARYPDGFKNGGGKREGAGAA